MLLDKIHRLPLGYSEVLYRNKKYGVTRTVFNGGNSHKVYAEQLGGNSHKVYAEQLGGNDFISMNYYVTEKSIHLRPCEMPDSKVIDFLNWNAPIEN